VNEWTMAALGVMRDVAPVVAMLLFFQLVVLRQPLPQPIRIARGVLYVIAGMLLFLRGLEEGVFPLGEAMAQKLTDPSFLFGGNGASERFDWKDYAWVYAFGFFVGLGTTLAEPALIAVGMKAEDVSGGAISAWGLRLAVSLGVAVGVALGCWRIVTGSALWLFIVAAYIVVVVQTVFAPRYIIPIAYDSGGVTTSTVTVPLLTALGIGLASTIPGRSPLIDGFGLIAFASVFPIMTVIGYAWIAEALNRRK